MEGTDAHLRLSTRGLSSLQALHQGFGSLQTLTVVCLALATVTMGLRLYVRRAMVKIFGPEDWAMLVAFLFFVIHTSLLIVVFRLAALLFSGRIAVLLQVEKLFHICYGFYILCLLVLKLSMGFFFLRILRHHTVQVAIIYALCAAIVVSGLIFYGFAVFTCAQFRDLASIRGQCRYQLAADVTNTIFSGLNILSGVVFVGLAVHPLIKSKMQMPTKIVASLILALGSVGCVASAVRLSLILEPTDYTRWLAQFMYSGHWLVTEVTSGIVAANLALIRPLISLIRQKLSVMMSRRSSEASGHNSTEAAHVERATMESQKLKGQGETLAWIEKNVVLSASDMESRQALSAIDPKASVTL
ncbi:hypothetical protein KVT40_007403 [Elsinoe batatas]|uniref:Rhodopsin domain-containing protein n=1 Tax=Elsinoe batatas TaxID=2601811 RepID=A0A8K0KYI5_9PEZI|nr:hypothetical protein KVT40_007403 [Elsinoe batatas]